MRPGRALAGVYIVLAVEYGLRNLLVPLRPTEATVRAVLMAEWALLAGLLAVWVPRVEHADWRQLGFGRIEPEHVWLGAGWFVAATLASAAAGAALGAVGLASLRDLQPHFASFATPTLVALALTGPVVEEILYRGYLIERLTALTGRIGLAAAGSWLAFTAVHLGFFGLGPTLNAAVLSAALVWLYLRERNLWPVIVLHGLNSLLAYLIVPLLPEPGRHAASRRAPVLAGWSVAAGGGGRSARWLVALPARRWVGRPAGVGPDGSC